MNEFNINLVGKEENIKKEEIFNDFDINYLPMNNLPISYFPLNNPKLSNELKNKDIDSISDIRTEDFISEINSSNKILTLTANNAIKITKDINVDLLLVGGGGGGAGGGRISNSKDQYLYMGGGGGGGEVIYLKDYKLKKGIYDINIGTGGDGGAGGADNFNSGADGNNGKDTYIHKDNKIFLTARGGNKGNGGSITNNLRFLGGASYKSPYGKGADGNIKTDNSKLGELINIEGDSKYYGYGGLNAKSSNLSGNQYSDGGYGGKGGDTSTGTNGGNGLAGSSGVFILKYKNNDFEFIKKYITDPNNLKIDIIASTGVSIEITTDNPNYKLLVYRTTGKLILNKDIYCDILIVGSGGTGGWYGGGGGGGGVVENNNYILNSGTYNIIIGDGGNNSIIKKGDFKILAAGGGGNGESVGYYKSTDGTIVSFGYDYEYKFSSGGGGGLKNIKDRIGSGSGNLKSGNGGKSSNTNSSGGGGGGGDENNRKDGTYGTYGIDGTSGIDGTDRTSGNGGIGRLSKITGSKVYYGGGGGGAYYDAKSGEGGKGGKGGNGGNGGGGNGGYKNSNVFINGTNGQDNTGGGGGGYFEGGFGLGGSGIVIIRVKKEDVEKSGLTKDELYKKIDKDIIVINNIKDEFKKKIKGFDNNDMPYNKFSIFPLVILILLIWLFIFLFLLKFVHHYFANIYLYILISIIIFLLLIGSMWFLYSNNDL